MRLQGRRRRRVRPAEPDTGRSSLPVDRTLLALAENLEVGLRVESQLPEPVPEWRVEGRLKEGCIRPQDGELVFHGRASHGLRDGTMASTSPNSTLDAGCTEAGRPLDVLTITTLPNRVYGRSAQSKYGGVRRPSHRREASL